MAELATFQVIIAADMIYDDDLTEAFVRCMASFLESDAGRPGEDPGSIGDCQSLSGDHLSSVCPLHLEIAICNPLM